MKVMPANNEIPVGRIAGVFGIHGELKCDPSSAGRSLFSRGEKFRVVRKDGTSTEETISAVREHKNRLLLRLSGVDSANAAEAYAGATLYADAQRIVLDPGEYLDRDLIGCELRAPDGTRLGAVSDVQHYPSSDMLIVAGKMVPMIKEFIKKIDVSAKRIDVDLPPGLLDED